MSETNKINRTIKIYPIFYGLTADLIFWIAINTLFLTTIKNLEDNCKIVKNKNKRYQIVNKNYKNLN